MFFGPKSARSTLSHSGMAGGPSEKSLRPGLTAGGAARMQAGPFEFLTCKLSEKTAE